MLGISIMRVVGFSGGLSSPSKTFHLVKTIVDSLQEHTYQRELIDFSEQATMFGSVLDRRSLAIAQQKILTSVEKADVLVVAVTIYKAAYPGLVKHFFDLIDREALQAKVVILAANGASAHHALVIESHLRPLFASLGAYTVPTGIYSQSSDFNAEYQVVNPAIIQRIQDAIAEALDLQQRLIGNKKSAA